MKKIRILSIILVMAILMGILEGTAFGAAPTPELFAYRILSRSTVLKAENPVAYAFNERKDLSENMPYFEGDTAMVPVRFLAKSFTAECEWESSKGGSFIVEQRTCTVIRIQAGKTITADGIEKKADVLPTMKNGTLYVPAKAFAEAMKITYKEDKDTGLMFFSRESEDERHEKVDYKSHILPYFDEKYTENEESFLYVATTGSDETGDGSKENPFLTIEKAKLEVRKLSENQKGDITVFVRGGTYRVSEPIRFEVEDSGKNGYKIIYKAYENEKVILDGSKVVSGWKLYSGNIYVADYKSDEPVHVLYEDGNMCYKARHPNRDPKEARAGFLQTLGNADSWYGISWAEGEIPYVKNTDNLELYVWPGGAGGYWMWFAQVSKLKEYNQKTRTMKMSTKAKYELGAGSRYYMMGALEFLDREGEFYHDTKEGKLYYIPYGYGQAGKTITVPVSDGIISFNGKSQSETVRNIEISGMEMRNTKRAEQLSIYAGLQKLEANGNAVELLYAENCSVLDCYIHDIGGAGVFAKKFFANNKINGNKIHTTGLDGVNLIEDGVFCASNNTVLGNLIHSPAQVLGQAMGVSITGGGDNFVKHNRIYNVTRSAINFGQGGSGHTYVGYNDCSDCNTAAEDTGMIYSTHLTYEGEEGKEVIGSSIYNNFLHDSGAGFMSWSAIYSDDISHNTRTQNNIITRMQPEGEDKLGYYISGIFAKGINYKIINNVVANSHVVPRSGSYILQYSNGPISSEGYVVEKNISYNHGPNNYYLSELTERTFTSVDNNIFYDENAQGYVINGTIPIKDYADWRNANNASLDQNSITEDPKFMNTEKDDYRLRYDSPAKSLGIKTVKQSTIGLYEDFAYTDENDEIIRLYIKRGGYSDTLSAVNLKSGENAQLSVSARTEDGFLTVPLNVKYKTDAPEVVDVDEFGAVTAKTAGKAKITACVEQESGEISTDLYVFVDDEIVEFKLDKDMYYGEEGQPDISAIVMGRTKYGQILAHDEMDNLEFNVEDNSVATVDGGGNIAFIKPGKSTLSATGEFNGVSVSANVPVECVEHTLLGISIEQQSKVIKAGNETTVRLTGVGLDETTVPLTGVTYTLEALNNDVAGISSQSGTEFVLSAYKHGKAEFKATATWMGRTFETTAKLMVTTNNSLIGDWKVTNYTSSEGFVLEDEKGLTIYSNGQDIYRADDDFTFVYKEESAENLTIEASILDVDSAQTTFSSTGIMLRDENTSGSYNVSFRYLPSAKEAMVTWRNPEFSFSKDINVSSVFEEFKYCDPVKLRLQKKGDVIIASCMDESGTWHVIKEVEVLMGDSYLAGVTSFSGNSDAWFTSRTEDVKIYEGIE